MNIATTVHLRWHSSAIVCQVTLTEKHFTIIAFFYFSGLYGVSSRKSVRTRLAAFSRYKSNPIILKVRRIK